MESPGLPFPAHRAAYEVAHEDGDPEGAGGVLLITFFAGPALESDEWARLHAVFAARQGYLGTRLHAALGPADFCEVVRWSSPLMYARALQLPETADAIAALPFAGRAALYLRL